MVSTAAATGSLPDAAQSAVLDQVSAGVDTARTPDPGFFVLGAKSYGRNSQFLMRVGWAQVDEVFGLLSSG